MTETARGVLRLITGAAEPAVSLSEAKAHLRVDFSDDDTMIQAYLDAATAHFDGPEGVLGRCLVNMTYALDLPWFPRQVWLGDRPYAYREDIRKHRHIDLSEYLCGVSSVTSITYVDADGNNQTLGTDVYTLATDNRFRADIALKYGQCWPLTQHQDAAVSITFVSGFGNAAAVPSPIKAAILLMVGDLYENRESQTVRWALAPNATVDALAYPYRRPVLV